MINVLMIEDDPEFAQILSEYLIKFNIKVTNYEDPYLGLSAGIKNYDLLILDDFASERKSDYMYEVLYNIVNDRYNAHKTMIFTSNMTTEETGNPTDPHIRRIMSRIWEMTSPVEVTGQDRRKASGNWK